MNTLVGTRPLVRLALRRDRIILPIWIVLLGFTPGASVSSYESLFPDHASRAALAAGAGHNPSISVLYGPAFDLTSAGGFTAWRYGGLLAVFVGLMAVFTVTRHTRAEEDAGRLELIGSTVVGRYAALTAAVLVSTVASLLIGVLIAVGLIGNGLPASGSVALGLGITVVGWVFTGVSAIAAQLTEYSRTANGLGCTVLGVTFLLRAVGDSSNAHWLSWLSPIGWEQQLRAFAGERWWVLLLAVAVTALCMTAGYLLLPRRDVGAGLLPQRPGPATASRSLNSAFGLAWRMHRGTLLGWSIGIAVVGGVFGSMAKGVGDLVGGSKETVELLQRMGGSTGLVNTFLAIMTGLYGVFGALYAIQAVLRMRSEETALRVEPVLATRTGRLRFAAAHLAFSLLGTAVLLLIAGLFGGLSDGLREGDLGGRLSVLLGGSLAQLPAAWVLAAVAMLLFGVLPRLTTAAWGVVAATALITVLGPTVNASQAVLDISPFTHIPKLPGSTFTMTPLIVLTVIAAIGVAVGLAAFRRRDIG